MKRIPLAITALLTLFCWTEPSRAHNFSDAILADCTHGMTLVTQGHPQLQALPNFFRERARRAQVVGQDVIATETGTRGTHFWVIVRAADRQQQATFQYDPFQDLFYLTAVPMTQVWMGLGCLHETVHAKDILEGKEPRNASRQQFLEGERRAFEIELMAVDHFTQGAFSEIVQDILARKRFQHSETMLIPDDSARADLDQLFPQPVAASPQERAVRDGFYVVALNFARSPHPAERLQFLGKLY